MAPGSGGARARARDPRRPHRSGPRGLDLRTPPPAAQRAAWEDAARAADVPLLVDSAAGFGAVADDGRVLSRQGDMEVFSFHATKPFAIGEGGVITTADDELARRAMRLANFGFEAGVIEHDVGLNAKLSEWSAATALAVLDGYDAVLGRRRECAQQMLDALDPHDYQRQYGSEGAAWQFVPVLAPLSRLARRGGRERAPQPH
jgi:dTDP-4-amino-4,6-dideoxygalactose transaminase